MSALASVQFVYTSACLYNYSWKTMSGAISNIKPLTEDHERYEDVFSAFSKVAQKDVVLEKVIQYFDATVMKRLTDVFGSGEELSLLGVGVGEGMYSYFFDKIRGLRPLKNIHV